MKVIKKTLCLLLTMLLLISGIIPVMADDNIKVKLNGELINFDVQPRLINNRTMVPLRAIFEALGATVEWDGDTQTVTSTKDGTTIKLTIDDPSMYVNSKSVTLDSPACLIDNRTLVPVRAISEAFNLKVEWDGNTQTVDISATKSEKFKQLLYNQHGLKITCNGYEMDEYGNLDIKLLIENESDQEYTVMEEEISINGFVLDGLMIETVPAGKKANTKWHVSYREFEENDITDIEKIELRITYSYGGSIIKSHNIIIEGSTNNNLANSECEHETVVVKGTPATCKETGLTDGEKCTKCNEMIVKQVQIPPSAHEYENGKCVLCKEMDSNYTPEYSVGDVWGDEGVWEFVVNSVEKHKSCNKHYNGKYDNKQVVRINYTYKNIDFDFGTSAYKDVLSFSSSNMKVYDEHGEQANSYVCLCDSAITAKLIKKDQKCTATEEYVLANDSDVVTLEVRVNLFKNGGVEKRSVKYTLPLK